MKITLDTFGQYLDCPRLGKTGSALDQQVAVAQERDQHPVDQVRLADDQPAGMRLKLLKLLYNGHPVLRSKKSACHCRDDALARQLVALFFALRGPSSVIMLTFRQTSPERIAENQHKMRRFGHIARRFGVQTARGHGADGGP